MATERSIESVQQDALDLQPAARVQLAHALVQSLARLPQSEIADIWLGEADRRDAEMESGRVVGIPGEEVFLRLHARYTHNG